MKPVSALFLLLLITGCNEEENTEFRQYTGHYTTISFKADTSVDLNNDGISSQELINEINSFDFNDLEIRPGEHQNNDVKMLYFFFPKTWITFQFPSNPEGYVEFLHYGFGTLYEFKNNSFKLEEKNYIEKGYIDDVESNRVVTIASNLEVLDSTHLKLSISKEYYDFNVNDWVMLNIDIIYEKY